VDALPFVAGVAVVAGFGSAWHALRRLRRAEARVAALTHELAAERHAASHDPLTGLPNRRAFDRLGSALLAAPPGPHLFAVVLDLDNFKQINDRFGHAAGDEVLIAVAQRFSAYAKGRLVARLGGDEFAALITGPTDDETWLRYVSQRLTELIAAPMQVAGELVTVTGSVGLAAVPAGAGLSEALCRADAAMYRAKDRARARACERAVRATIRAADPTGTGAPPGPTATGPGGRVDHGAGHQLPDEFNAPQFTWPPATRHPPAPPTPTRQLVDTTRRTDTGGP
jgi:diguanylate cyclase (GGDEF)-like protein